MGRATARSEPYILCYTRVNDPEPVEGERKRSGPKDCVAIPQRKAQDSKSRL